MIRFENPEWLYLLFLVPVFVAALIFFMRKKKKMWLRFADAPLLDRLIPEYSSGKQILKYTLLILSFTFLVFAIANPQTGISIGEAERKGVDIMVCLDVSNSMKAEDAKPNRLLQSQQGISRMIDKLNTDRIGIVIFAGSSFVHLPLTGDYSIAKSFTDIVSTDMVSTQGTAIGDAINTSLNGLGQIKDKKGKTIVVITDGENHEDDAVQAAKEAKSKGIPVHVIGVGSTQGTLIPEYKNGQPAGYKKDQTGNPVLTKLNDDALKQIATAGGGKYIHTHTVGNALETLYDSFQNMEQNEYAIKSFNEYEDRFQYMLVIAMLLLVTDVFIHERKNKYINEEFLFSKKKGK